LRVLSGRLKAVLVATLATIILIGIIGPATTLASDPPGLGRFMTAMGRVESGGRYYARNARSGAYGKYQIMPSSWRAWAGRYLGNPYAKQTPRNQEIVAAAKFRTLYHGLASWRRVAFWWLTGSSRTTGWSSFATRYVTRVMRYYQGASATAVPTVPTVAMHHYSERSPSIAYSGTWKSAGSARYTGKAAAYATAIGATATFTFHGKRVVWYGPVGPTRGQARISVDGVYVTTANTFRSSFVAHKALYGKAWATAGKHTLTIEVVGTRGHPYVAIDEFVVVD
jgi:hypothetical protein